VLKTTEIVTRSGAGPGLSCEGHLDATRFVEGLQAINRVFDERKVRLSFAGGPLDHVVLVYPTRWPIGELITVRWVDKGRVHLYESAVTWNGKAKQMAMLYQDRALGAGAYSCPRALGSTVPWEHGDRGSRRRGRVQPSAVTGAAGGSRARPSWLSTRGATTACDAAGRRRRPASIMPRPTRATSACSGTGATGGPAVGPATAARRLRWKAASGDPAGDRGCKSSPGRG
jgi:hypothetical protein